ncbi:MAG: peptidoglycan DD-metalloendopeptidase family protein [Flavobacteriales bacterium]|nr:peptidoglycan DD-metalloendopeptidase family protein [Flavobacteriales bacterium]NQX97203.1 peptidoglycan DD-metalloendopeptidase family protein [Flavobacteriales bacterium]
MLLILSANSTFAQNKKELEQRKKKLQKEIKLTNKLLKETRKNKDLSVDELLKLKSKITSRSNLIATMNSEMKLINKEISGNKQEINGLESDLTYLKSEYAKIIYYAFKHKNSYDKMMFIFASKDVNQAYKRLKYIQQYSEYRKGQATEIVSTQKTLTLKIASLKQSNEEKTVLVSLEEQEKQNLAIEKVEQENIVEKLQGKEQELKNKLKKKEAAKRKLQKAIQRIIEEEIRKAREAAKRSGNKSKGFPLTPEALKLSNSFASNKGKLPWPVKQGVITAQFGKHAHPVLKGIVTNNNGIDISTTKGATSRAIFNGIVSSVAIIPGEGKVVMVRHGEYLSVYSYMSEVFVSKGDEISIKQELGVLINEAGKSKTQVHLEIWKGMTKLNPKYWIFRK